LPPSNLGSGYTQLHSLQMSQNQEVSTDPWICGETFQNLSSQRRTYLWFRQ